MCLLLVFQIAENDSYTKEMKPGRVSVLPLIFNKAFSRAGRPTKVSAQLLPSIPGDLTRKMRVSCARCSSLSARGSPSLFLSNSASPFSSLAAARSRLRERGVEMKRRILRPSQWPGGPPPAADIFTSPPRSSSVLTYLSLLAISSELRWQHVRLVSGVTLAVALCAVCNHRPLYHPSYRISGWILLFFKSNFLFCLCVSVQSPLHCYFHT